MIKYSFLFILILASVGLTAQNDSIKKETNRFADFSTINNIDAKIVERNIEILPDETPIDKAIKEEIVIEKDISYLFKEKEEKSVLSYKKSKYINPNDGQGKNEVRMIQPKQSENEDILVVKHFNGKNVSRTNLATAQNLGTIETNTKFVRIEYRDYGRVDGDRVKVFLNEKEIASNIVLSGMYYTMEVKLEEKGYNRIDIQAINQGFVGPNTAEFIVYDDKGNIISHKAWNLQKGSIATLGFVRF